MKITLILFLLISTNTFAKEKKFRKVANESELSLYKSGYDSCIIFLNSTKGKKLKGESEIRQTACEAIVVPSYPNRLVQLWLKEQSKDQVPAEVQKYLKSKLDQLTTELDNDEADL